MNRTVSEYNGPLHFAYLPYVGPVSGITIAQMVDPWTITGVETMIATPD